MLLIVGRVICECVCHSSKREEKSQEIHIIHNSRRINGDCGSDSEWAAHRSGFTKRLPDAQDLRTGSRAREGRE